MQDEDMSVDSDKPAAQVDNHPGTELTECLMAGGDTDIILVQGCVPVYGSDKQNNGCRLKKRVT
jgi:hypothetical protein